MRKFTPNHLLKFIAVLLVLQFIGAGDAFAYPEDKGVTAAGLLQQLGIAATIIALVGLIATEFFLKKRIRRSSYKWILFIGLFMLPVIAMLSSFTVMMEDTKTVQSCASCHIMQPFVTDMMDPDSPTLAARHYKNKWIADDQCYHCHTSYGIHGTAEAKRDGFRHWLLYVTDTWPEPITFKGSYPNGNCTSCHGETAQFRAVDSHRALREKLTANEVSCASCHGPIHPTPLERDTPGRTAGTQIEQIDQQEDIQAISAYIQSLNTSAEHRETHPGAKL